nr:hypothetical protein [Tanacetum cinerariifolium]
MCRLKECSSCGALNNKSCGCSKGGFVDKFVPDKTPNSSQRPLHDCPKCENPVDGLHCRQCVLLRKKLKEVRFTIRDEHNFFQDLLNTFGSSNDDSNVVNAPQEPFVFNQDPSENSSQSPPHIDHNCCYECGGSLDSIFCQRCTYENSFAYDSTPNFVNDSPNVFNPPSQPPAYSYEFCGNDAHYGHNCPPQVPFIYNPESCYNQDFNLPQNFQSFQQQYPCCESCGGPHENFQCQQVIFYEPYCKNCGDQVVNLDSYSPKHLQCRKIPIYYNNDDDEESSTPLRNIIIYELPPCIAITPVLSTNEAKDSLIMGDECLDTIPKKESGEFIKSSVKNLVPNPSESDDLSNIGRDDDKSFSDEDVPKEIYSNPLFDEEIISIKKDPHHFNVESDLIESMLNQDSSSISSSKIDSLLDEFVGELIFLKSIPSGIDEADCDPEEEIRLIEKLFDPFMKEIDLFLTSDGSIPPGIDSDYSDSERDNLFPKRLLHDDPIPLPDILDSSNVVRIFPPFFTYPVTSLIILSSGSEDTIFDPGISDYHFSSFMPSVSHRSGTFMKFNVYPNHLNEIPMEILSSTCSLMDQ